MTEEVKSFQYAGAGQPDKPAETQAQTGSDEKQYVTRPELEAAISKIEKLAQSMTGKAEARIQKQLAALQAAGIQATPEQVERLVQSAEDASQQPQPQPSKSTPAQAKQEGGDLDPVSQIAVGILSRAGIDPKTVGVNDPDANLINTQAETEEEYISSVRAYVKAKGERKGSPARLPNLGSGQGAGGGGKAALTSELTELLTHPSQQNIKRIQELRRQLAQMK
jgi:hypothetical protein